MLDGRTLSEDPAGYQKNVGYVPEEPYLYTHLTATEYLTLIARLRRLSHTAFEKKIPELLRLLQLHDTRYSTMAAFSKGMRQRVLIAAALLHNPELLVLDEPFAGLDVNAGLLFRALLGLFAADGHMILFSTHRFDMVEKLCSRVVILSSGRVVAEQDLAALGTTGEPTLEDTFCRVTKQADFRPLAREILDTIQA
jgi:ABC-2 type transport system ATP-binding protein